MSRAKLTSEDDRAVMLYSVAYGSRGPMRPKRRPQRVGERALGLSLCAVLNAAEEALPRTQFGKKTDLVQGGCSVLIACESFPVAVCLEHTQVTVPRGNAARFRAFVNSPPKHRYCKCSTDFLIAARPLKSDRSLKCSPNCTF
jgi:hypothetical protein